MAKNQSVTTSTQIGVVNGFDEGYCTATALANLLRPLIVTDNGPEPVFTSGAGVPTVAPAADAPKFYIDTATDPDNLYWWNGSAWQLIGDGVGVAGAVDVCSLVQATAAQISAMDGTDFVAVCIDGSTVKVPLSELGLPVTGGGGGGSPSAIDADPFDTSGPVLRSLAGGPALPTANGATATVPNGVTHLLFAYDKESNDGSHQYSGFHAVPVTPGQTITYTKPGLTDPGILSNGSWSINVNNAVWLQSVASIINTMSVIGTRANTQSTNSPGSIWGSVAGVDTDNTSPSHTVGDYGFLWAVKLF